MAAPQPVQTIDPRVHRGIAAFLEWLPTIDLPPVSRIILYGSHARGDFHEESDTLGIPNSLGCS